MLGAGAPARCAAATGWCRSISSCALVASSSARVDFHLIHMSVAVAVRGARKAAEELTGDAKAVR